MESIAKRMMRISAALQFMAKGIDAVSGEGNEPVPGLIAAGLESTCYWAAEELEKLAKELAS